jgi:hypothetical protein
VSGPAPRRLLTPREREVAELVAALAALAAAAGSLTNGPTIASKVFDSQLEVSAVAKAIDGRFRCGPLPAKDSQHQDLRQARCFSIKACQDHCSGPEKLSAIRYSIHHSRHVSATSRRREH